MYYHPLPARTGIRVGASPPPTFRATVPYALFLFVLLSLGLPLLQYCYTVAGLVLPVALPTFF